MIKLGTIQEELQNLNKKIQNIKTFTTIYGKNKLFSFSTMSTSPIAGGTQASNSFTKYNHLHPPDAAAFLHSGHNS